MQSVNINAGSLAFQNIGCFPALKSPVYLIYIYVRVCACICVCIPGIHMHSAGTFFLLPVSLPLFFLFSPTHVQKFALYQRLSRFCLLPAARSPLPPATSSLGLSIPLFARSLLSLRIAWGQHGARSVSNAPYSWKNIEKLREQSRRTSHPVVLRLPEKVLRNK